MTFSEQVKQELVRLTPEKTCCMLSELSALTQACASLILRGAGRVQVRYSVENAPLAKRIFLLLKERLSIIPSVAYHINPRLGGRRIMTLTVPENEARRLLMALHMLRHDETGDVFHGVPRGALSRRCCRQAFLRGAFLGAGSMGNPEKTYRIEFVSASPERADALRSILAKSDIVSGVTQRRGATVVYVTNGDQVADLLTLMGAQKALLQMVDIRIRRSSRGQANRAMNCDAGNFKKQLSAAEKQTKAIRDYSLNVGLVGLPQQLQEAARARLLNPDASLEQLGALLSPPLGKSGINHRLRRLMDIIDENTKGK